MEKESSNSTPTAPYGTPPPRQSPQALIDEHYPGATIGETDHTDINIVTQGTEKMLLFIKSITGEVAFYNMRISKNAFGPELIHEDDYKKIQQHMRQMEIKKCIYVIHSTDKKVYVYQHTFPLDMHYLEWIAEGA